MGLRTLAGLALAAAVLAFSSAPARADLRICNETKTLIGVAIGYREKNKWITEGWWRIPPSACAPVLEGGLTSRYYYLHGEDAESGRQWRGPIFMCTSNKQFRIESVQNCFSRGYERTGFFEIDTGNQKIWRVGLNDENRSKEEVESQ